MHACVNTLKQTQQHAHTHTQTQLTRTNLSVSLKHKATANNKQHTGYGVRQMIPREDTNENPRRPEATQNTKHLWSSGYDVSLTR